MTKPTLDADVLFSDLTQSDTPEGPFHAPSITDSGRLVTSELVKALLAAVEERDALKREVERLRRLQGYWVQQVANLSKKVSPIENAVTRHIELIDEEESWADVAEEIKAKLGDTK